MSQPSCLYCPNLVIRDGCVCRDCLEDGIAPASGPPMREVAMEKPYFDRFVSRCFVETELSVQMYHGPGVRDDV